MLFTSYFGLLPNHFHVMASIGKRAQTAMIGTTWSSSSCCVHGWRSYRTVESSLPKAKTNRPANSQPIISCPGCHPETAIAWVLPLATEC